MISRLRKTRSRLRQIAQEPAKPTLPPKFVVAAARARWSRRRREGDDWLHEIKYDGYRAIAAVGGGKAVDLHPQRPRLDRQVPPAGAAARRPALPLGAPRRRGRRSTDKDGHTDFGALQDAIGEGGRRHRLLPLRPPRPRRRGPPRLPLVERKARLAALLKDQPASGPLFYSDHVVGSGADDVRARLRA